MTNRHILVSSLALILILATAAGSQDIPAVSGNSGRVGWPGVADRISYASSGPFAVYNADSSSSLRFQFAGQMRLMYENREKSTDTKRTDAATMEARRIRLTLSGTIRLPDLAYRLHLSTAPRSLELMDFYFNYRLSNNLQFRFGQYKIPFTRYRIQSFQQLVFTDWAIVTGYFGAERQMGFSFHNGYEKPPAWAYAVGVFTGVNARASHAVGLADFYDVEVVNPSDLTESAPRTEFHPELVFHGAYNGNGINVRSATDAARAGWRYAFGLSLAWDIDPDPLRDLALRVASEFLMKYRGVSFVGVGYGGWAEIDGRVKSDPALLGLLTQMAWRFRPNMELSGRYAVVDSRDILTGSETLAALMAENDDAGQILREEELSAGLNLYIIEHSLKWQNDVSWLRHTRPAAELSDYRWRSQFQLTF